MGSYPLPSSRWVTSAGVEASCMRHCGRRFKGGAGRPEIGAVCKVMQLSLLAQAIPNPLIRRRDKPSINCRFARQNPLLTGEPSCKDEARIGQKNGLVRQWARRGTRPRQPADQRYENAYLFGAICPAKGKGAALALPYADTEMMQLHLDEISRHVEKGAHAVLLLDRAGWHTTGKLDMPKNITPILLPSRAPELNPVENVWQYLRQNWLSNVSVI